MAHVVLPCLNEAPALPDLLARIPAGYTATVVDNGSTDGSADVARAHGARVITEPTPGYGAAVHAGILAALPDPRRDAAHFDPGRAAARSDAARPDAGWPDAAWPDAARPDSARPDAARPDGWPEAARPDDDIVCVMDADGSLDPAELLLLVAPILTGAARLVVGRRRPAGPGAWPLHARLANAFLARQLRRSSGLGVHDLGPMRAARRADLLALNLQDRRFGYPLELLIAAARAGWTVAEVDVTYRPRAAGTRSKVTGSVGGTLRAVRDMSAVLAR